MTLLYDPKSSTKLDRIEEKALPASVPVVTPLVTATTLGLAAFVVTGSSIAAFGVCLLPGTLVYLRVKNWIQAKRFEREHTGCIAHLIDSDQDYRHYLEALGSKEVKRQLLLALDHEQPLTHTAQKVLETLVPPEELPTSCVRAFLEASGGVIEVKSTSSPNDSPEPSQSLLAASESTLVLGDLVGYMADPLKPTIVSAVPRTGKGYLAAQVIKAAKAQGYSVWVLQPKPHKDEYHYWQQCDRFLGVPLEQRSKDDEGYASEMTAFITEWRSQSAKTLLVVDELVKIQVLAPKWYKDFLIPNMIVEGSSGETSGRIVYLLTQSPLVTDLGMSGGNRATFEFLALEKTTSQGHAKSIKRSNDAIEVLPPIADYAKSPVGVLAYYSRSNGWHPIPRYQVAPIGQGDTLCPDLAQWVYGQSDEAYGDPKTVDTVAEAVPSDYVAQSERSVELSEAYRDAMTLLEESDDWLSLTVLCPQTRLRSRIKDELIDMLASTDGIGYRQGKRGAVISHSFRRTTDDAQQTADDGHTADTSAI